MLLAGDRRIVLPLVHDQGQEGLNEVNTISDDGRTIAGRAWKTDDNFHAVVWTCR